MKLGLMLPAKPDIKWQLAKQIGVTNAITKAAPELTGKLPPWDFDSLKETVETFAEAGFKLRALEGDEFDMSRIKMGLDGRDEDIERYQQMLRNMGKLGVPMICYNFMVGIGWHRSRVDLPERGGALTSGFDMADIDNKVDLIISEDEVWANFEYFIKAVMPVAEEAGVKMALHPDDPPVSPLMGYGRILTSADAYRRAMEIVSSPSHGIAFCQATFRAMGEDIFSLIPEFGKAGKIFFVHLRDIKGEKTSFRETFHDNGPTDMGAALAAYRDAGVDCLMRPDHTPSMAGEENAMPGYEMQGRLFAVGYIKGLMDALGINY
ncbi:MAG: mannonate dehydratase [Planctomycetes bacterium]|nr:mannonate dehydratase [Planctomycetota bacterium]